MRRRRAERTGGGALARKVTEIPMIDLFKSHARTLTSPPEYAMEIMPSDLEEQAYVTRALYIGGAGDVVVRLKDDVVVTLANVPAGTFLPLRIQQVLGTGTTATSIVGFW